MTSNVPCLLFLLLVPVALIAGATSATSARAAVSPSQQASTCNRELENANSTLSNWADNMEQMVNESKLGPSIRESVHNEANQILDLIEEFGEQIKLKPPSQLVKDLITIRRRANRMALDVYLNTFDMRWPQNSLQLGIIVERVQQACLDRNSIQALEAAPPAGLESILMSNLNSQKRN